MEQSVWLYVGIISALIGLGFVASIIIAGRETSKQQAVENTIRKMQQNCNSVCTADTETMFKTDVTFVSGMKLYSMNKPTNGSICVDYKDSTNCQQCNCQVFDKEGNSFEMDFSTPEARQLFDTHDYECFMERTEKGVAVECKG